MDNSIIDLSFLQILSAYVFIVLLLIIVKIKGISREKDIIISSIRMTLQLIAVAYILSYIFENPSPFLTILILLLMEIFAIYTIISRSKMELTSKIKKIIAISMFAGTIFSLFFFLLVVIGIKPWFKPQYFIPIAGMLIGNSMTGISLGVNNLVSGFYDNRNMLEGCLMLGARPKKACKSIVDKAFDSAILPTINSMLGMGIVFLPGMMTGQILSGISPLTAISYQIAIMLGILGSVSLSVALFINLASKSFFNSKDQLMLKGISYKK